jgi:hypothetical protein
MNRILRTLLTLLVLSRTPAFAQSLSLEKEVDEQTQNQVSPTLFKHGLSGLYGIASFSSNVSQPYTNFEQFYAQAQAAQIELETICKSTALLSNTNTVFSGVKSKHRAEQKIATDLSGDVQKITDVVRATIVADDVASLVSTYEILEQQVTIVSVKNRFKKPAASGYRDLNLLVQLPKSKIIAEVQLHLDAIAQVKSGPEHDIYKVIQTIERKAVNEQRVIHDFEAAQINALRNQSKALYQQAWQPYLTTKLKAA